MVDYSGGTCARCGHALWVHRLDKDQTCMLRRDPEGDWWDAAGLTLAQWVDRCLHDGPMTEGTAADLRRYAQDTDQPFAEWVKGGIPLSQLTR